MITAEERAELLRKGREDGARLFRVSQVLYQVMIGIVALLGVGGVILALALMGQQGVVAGLAALLVTAVICLVVYALAVLSTHGAKVLVHLLFSSLATMEGAGK